MTKRIDRVQTFLQSYRGLSVILLIIILVNSVFYNLNFSDKQSRKGTSGFSIDKAKHFAYFNYYTGYFPLSTLNDDLEFSKAAAYKEIEENGEDLIMEYQHWSRLGENARIWAFLPNAIATGSPENPSIKLFNSLVFVISLLILYYGFWRSKLPIYGIILIGLINLTPYFLYEVYMNQNIFYLLGCSFFIILGLNVSFLIRKESFTRFILTAILSGAILGFFSEFRNEVSIVYASLFLIYLLSTYTRIFFKILVIFISYFAFSGTRILIKNHFENKFLETTELVASHNGHVYNGKRIEGHKFWHPVFCGLGDFDTKHGFEWNDKVAYAYATPILQEKYGMDITYSDKYHLDNFYDADSLYYIKFDEIEEYEAVMKDKVITQIKEDTSWYLTIIFKRIIKYN